LILVDDMGFADLGVMGSEVHPMGPSMK